MNRYGVRISNIRTGMIFMMRDYNYEWLVFQKNPVAPPCQILHKETPPTVISTFYYIYFIMDFDMDFHCSSDMNNQIDEISLVYAVFVPRIPTAKHIIIIMTTQCRLVVFLFTYLIVYNYSNQQRSIMSFQWTLGINIDLGLKPRSIVVHYVYKQLILTDSKGCYCVYYT